MLWAGSYLMLTLYFATVSSKLDHTYRLSDVGGT